MPAPTARCGTRTARSPSTAHRLGGDVGGQHPDRVGPAERRVREVHDREVGPGRSHHARAPARAGSRAPARSRARAPRSRPRRRSAGSPRRTPSHASRKCSSNRGRRARSKSPWCRNHSIAFETDVVVEAVHLGSRASSWRSRPATVAAPRSDARRGRRRRSSPPATPLARCPRPPRRRSTSGSSALTMPPAPRTGFERAVVAHREPVRPSVRDEHHARRLAEQRQPVLELAGRQEVLAHVLAALRARARRRRPGSASRSTMRSRALVDRVDEVAVVAVADLQLDATGAPADDRPALPEALAHGEAEALAQRLLHDRRRRRAGTR